MGLSLNTVMTIFYQALEKAIDRNQKIMETSIIKLNKERTKENKANKDKMEQYKNEIMFSSGCVHALTEFLGVSTYEFESELEKILREQGC